MRPHRLWPLALIHGALVRSGPVMLLCVIVLGFVLGSCVFDNSGVKLSRVDARSDQPIIGPDRGHDGPGDTSPDHASDTRADRGSDLTPDLPIDPECIGHFGGYACRYEAVDAGTISPGQSGYCSPGGQFQIIRHCFQAAPCSDGLCLPKDCNDCWNASCTIEGQTCSLFLVNSGAEIRACCVEKHPAGKAVVGDPCQDNTDCVTQLCTSDTKVCTEPCTPVIVDRCSEGYHCGSVSVSIGPSIPAVNGCVKGLPDAGPPDSTASSDLPIPGDGSSAQ